MSETAEQSMYIDFNALRIYIRHFISKIGVSQRELARRAKISHASLNLFLNNKRGLSFNNFKKIILFLKNNDYTINNV